MKEIALRFFNIKQPLDSLKIKQRLLNTSVVLTDQK